MRGNWCTCFAIVPFYLISFAAFSSKWLNVEEISFPRSINLSILAMFPVARVYLTSRQLILNNELSYVNIAIVWKSRYGFGENALFIIMNSVYQSRSDAHFSPVLPVTSSLP